VRIAPEGGYNFGNKKQYRRTVWRQLADHCPVPRSEAVCVLMPSLEGDEIDVCLSKGFRPRNIHIVDREPAVVATLKRRYPHVNAHGIDVARMAERLPEGSVHCANLDLCGTTSNPTLETLMAFSSVLARPGACAVTVLRGRESGIGRQVIALSQQQRSSVEEICADVETNGKARGVCFNPRFSTGKKRDEAIESVLAMSTDDWRVRALVLAIDEGLSGELDRDVDGSMGRDGSRVDEVTRGIYKSTAGNQTMLYVACATRGPIDRLAEREAFREMEAALEEHERLMAEINAAASIQERSTRMALAKTFRERSAQVVARFEAADQRLKTSARLPI
jgi:hypothetical protein